MVEDIIDCFSGKELIMIIDACRSLNSNCNNLNFINCKYENCLIAYSTAYGEVSWVDKEKEMSYFTSFLDKYLWLYPGLGIGEVMTLIREEIEYENNQPRYDDEGELIPNELGLKKQNPSVYTSLRTNFILFDMYGLREKNNTPYWELFLRYRAAIYKRPKQQQDLFAFEAYNYLLEGIKKGEESAYYWYATLLISPERMPESKYYEIKRDLVKAISYLRKVNKGPYYEMAIIEIARIYNMSDKAKAFDYLKGNIPSRNGIVEKYYELLNSSLSESEVCYFMDCYLQCVNIFE